MKASVGIITAGLLTLCLSCKRVPDGIIHPDEMSDLMADIHIGEAVIDANYSEFMTDSARMLLKQSILAKHGYTTTDLDTSLVWYGGHLDMMQEIYVKTAEILEKRVAEGGITRGEGTSLSIDSTEIWPGNSYYLIRSTSPTRNILFSVSQDTTWNSGDSFTLRTFLTNNSSSARWSIIAVYSDGTMESVSSKFSGSGRQQIVFHTDSTKTADKVFGAIEFDVNDTKTIIADSLSLIRKPLDTQTYSQRYRQKKEPFYNRNKSDENKNE
ncbi:MAG: DUF4296 domain-containing protein [Muribaculaceae bacterium]|nr:DUF4296 domain-containing protein [Muribaculaceae bacterium]